jgi:Fe-Mn family superoxide dismutase
MLKKTFHIALFILFPLYALEHYPFSLLPRGYADSALEPHIDRETMKIHYEGHHATYVKNLNEELKDHPAFQKYSCKQLLTMLDKLPEKIRVAVRNNAGGHENHTFFWRCLTPQYKKPSKRLIKAIEGMPYFGSFEGFKQQFNQAAKKVFGSGWVWLCYDKFLGELFIMTTPNQDNPIIDHRPGEAIPLLALDVWEHAYYLKHQNKRASYIDAWWSVVNWDFVEENYKKALL